jgi:hypothetical protein
MWGEGHFSDYGQKITVKVIFYAVLPNFRRSIAFGRFPGFAPFVLLVNMQMKMSMEHWWNDTDRGKPRYSVKNLSK